MSTPSPVPTHSSWWRFVDDDPNAPATGAFQATGAERVGRLYYPLVNDAGMLSWTSPHLQGAPAAGHHAQLSLPLTAEDLPHVLMHRDVWLVMPDRPPWSLSGISPEGLTAHVAPAGEASMIDAGPGWFSLSRQDASHRVSVRATLWCPADASERLEVMRVEVTNRSDQPLRLSPYAAIPMFARSADNVRDHRHVTALLHRIDTIPHGVTVCPTMSFDERGHTANTTRYTVLAIGPRGAAPEAIWPVQDSFLGEGGTFAAPAAVWTAQRAPTPPIRHAAGREAIGAFRFADRTLAPGERVEYVLVSGISSHAKDAGRWLRWAAQPGALATSLEATKAAWQTISHRIAPSTADRTLDGWLAWVNVQPTLRRLYGNSYLPQFDYGRGGRGWRDLWQDCLALLLSDPAPVRAMLRHNFGGVRIDGSNATIVGSDGGFLADRNNIPRTWMDHGVWPLFTTLLYLDQTGDADFLVEEREYFRDQQLFRCKAHDPAWTERYGNQLRTRRTSVYRGTILEHILVQHLSAFFNVGEHNLCRLEGADWNDGLDMARTRGESVAFSAFYAWNLQRLSHLGHALIARGVRSISLARELLMLLDRLPGQRRVTYTSPSAKVRRLDEYLRTVARDVSGKKARVPLDALCRDLDAKHLDLAARISTQEWLEARQAGCFNGYYDDAGQRVERLSGPVRMTLTGQVFPIMSGIATEEQVDRVIATVDRVLRDPRFGGIRLNSDFGAVQPRLGRAFSFAYGEKENGAVFSHMAVMYAYALYLRRRPEAGRRAWHALYRMATNQPVARIFPNLPEYFNADGRGMYCYLTGSASWMMFLLLTRVFGVRGEWGDLVLDPQLTADDFGDHASLGIRCHFAQRPLVVRIERPSTNPARTGISAVTVQARPLTMTVRPEGGVRIARRLIEQLPKDRDSVLHVRLG